MKTHKLLWGLSLVGLLVLPAVGQDDPDQQSFWMRKKLEFSQSILAGLATADFDAIAKSATSMKNLTLIERMARRTDAEDYRMQLGVFQFANNELIRAAKKKDVDSATVAFTQLTLSCVNCHKLLRDGR